MKILLLIKILAFLIVKPCYGLNSLNLSLSRTVKKSFTNNILSQDLHDRYFIWWRKPLLLRILALSVDGKKEMIADSSMIKILYHGTQDILQINIEHLTLAEKLEQINFQIPELPLWILLPVFEKKFQKSMLELEASSLHGLQTTTYYQKLDSGEEQWRYYKKQRTCSLRTIRKLQGSSIVIDLDDCHKISNLFYLPAEIKRRTIIGQAVRLESFYTDGVSYENF